MLERTVPAEESSLRGFDASLFCSSEIHVKPRPSRISNALAHEVEERMDFVDKDIIVFAKI